MAERRHIVLGVTGSIAAYKAGDIIRRLKDKGFKVSVVMTKEAGHFITPLTLSSLSQDKVYCDMFDGTTDGSNMPHISLAKEADLILIAPATANVIAKIACGMADDLLTTVILATEAPVALAPAMNPVMYQNKIVRENCDKIRSLGVRFIEPVEGLLACGDHGVGHIAEAADIVEQVEKILQDAG